MTLEEVDASLPDRSLGAEFYSKYEPKEVLGRGLCSVVRRCVEKATQQSYAVKIIDITRKDNAEADQARLSGLNEIKLLTICTGQPYIITLHEAFETQAFLFLVFELCKQGELFDFLTQKIRLSEKRTRHIMKQLLEAISFLHSKNIIHRDIKCENILLNEQLEVRLSDFGFATITDDNICLKELLGTPGYLSPEMLRASMYTNEAGYGLPIDMWACGVVMFTMISGSPPFWNRKQMKMLRDIMEGNYTFSSPEWDETSDECKDVIRKMLNVNPNHRISANEALRHPFFTTTEQKETVNVRRKARAAFYCIRFIKRLKDLQAKPHPLSVSLLTTAPYSHKQLRKSIDEAAYRIYGHWVKKNDEQSRGALFEYKPKTDHSSSKPGRYRLLSHTVSNAES